MVISRPWKISGSEAKELRHCLNIPDLSALSPPEWNITFATHSVFEFIMANFRYRRQGETSLSDTFGWNYIE